MGEKFIPNGDYPFRTRVLDFAHTIARDPARFGLSDDDGAALVAAARRFEAALLKARAHATRSPVVTAEKNAAREDAKRLMERCLKRIRSNETIEPLALHELGLKPASDRRKRQACPQEPPRVRFVRALHVASGASPRHELSFGAINAMGKAKPAGAARLELFVDLVPPDEAIPSHPGANLGGRPWYLRSFTRSPIKVTPPMARVPMRVVYWARWADSTGDVGPFSATCVGWIEGGSQHHLPGAPATYMGMIGRRQTAPLLDVEGAAGPATREPSYSVAVRDAQYEYLNGQDAAAAPPQLEGPAESEAA